MAHIQDVPSLSVSQDTVLAEVQYGFAQHHQVL
jgi:hypothetical protein